MQVSDESAAMHGGHGDASKEHSLRAARRGNFNPGHKQAGCFSATGCSPSQRPEPKAERRHGR